MFRRCLTLATLLTMAMPALAQDRLHYDPEIATACLNIHEGEAQIACIGIASARCMDSSTAGMSECLAQETDQWDGMLNKSYQILLTAAEAADAEMKQLEISAPPSAPLLREMQRSWVAYRDAACAYAAAQFQGGTAAGPAAQACAMRLTGMQALRLGAMAERIE